MDWKTLLAYITGTVDQESLLCNEYLLTENRILRQQINGRVQLTDAQRTTLAEIGKKLGKQALAEVASIVKPKRPRPSEGQFFGQVRIRYGAERQGSDSRVRQTRSSQDAIEQAWTQRQCPATAPCTGDAYHQPRLGHNFDLR